MTKQGVLSSCKAFKDDLHRRAIKILIIYFKNPV
jgi:hypothetical protein